MAAYKLAKAYSALDSKVVFVNTTNGGYNSYINVDVLVAAMEGLPLPPLGTINSIREMERRALREFVEELKG